MAHTPEKGDRQGESLQRLRAEYRRVGVSEAEIEAQCRAEWHEHLVAHPDIRAQLETDPDYDPSEVGMAFSLDLALEVLATLPDGAGTAAYLARVRERARDWKWFERRPDA
jgi:hypothetical protein